MNKRLRGTSLPKQKWEQIAASIEAMTPVVLCELRKINYEGKGEDDAAQFEVDMRLAYAAVMYVAAFAADKCRVIGWKDV